MNENRTEDWREICKAAANELDPVRLMELIVELNRALDEHDLKRRKSTGENLPEENCGTRSFHVSPQLHCVRPA
jgi:hypothetical protein